MSETVKLTQDELVAECIKRFGDDKSKWAFQCPACEDIAVASDFSPFTESGYGSELLGSQCIGRFLGATSKSVPKGTYEGRGCDWAAFGLFRGPWFIIMPDGEGGTKEVPAFALAPPTVTDQKVEGEA